MQQCMTIALSFGRLVLGLLVSTYGLAETRPDDQQNVSTTSQTIKMSMQRPEWPNVEALWSETQPTTQDERDIWQNAIGRLGGYENIECRYRRHTEPSNNTKGGYPRVYIEAALNSLTRPGIKSLGSWFDTPAMHDIVAWQEEQFDPGAQTPWQLLTMDGLTPNARQLKSYTDEKSASVRRLETNELGLIGRRAQVGWHPAAIQAWFATREPTDVLRDESSLLILGTRPSRTTKLPLHRKTQMTWAINREDGNLKWFDQRILKPFSPHLGLRFQHFKLRGVFAYEETIDSVVLTHFEYELQNRLTLVFAVSNKVVHWYSDFSCDR